MANADDTGQPEQRRGLRFTGRDLLLIAVVSTSPPWLLPILSDGCTHREALVAAPFLFVLALLGAAVGVWRANKRGITGAGRGISLFVHMIVPWLLLLGLGYAFFAYLRGHCIVEGALVATPSGERPVETLCLNAAVLTGRSDGVIETGSIVGMRAHRASNYIHLRFADGGHLKVTAEHPLATPAGWRKADALRVGDAVTCREGETKVTAAEQVTAAVTVYDLTVQPNATFFANGILVHNKTMGSRTAAATMCQHYAEAQAIYHRYDYDGDGVLEYAQALRGSNSLFENTAGAADLCLIDKSLALAGDGPAGGQPKVGYYFKLLTAQGTHAKGGRMSYIVDGNMTRGCALIAYPARCGEITRDSFIISHEGRIFQKDLGPDTHAIAQAVTEFDPDESWVPTE